MTRPSGYRKYAQDVVIVGVTQCLVAASGIILLLLITKVLGAADYGIWSQVQVTVSLAVSFVGLGLPYAITRFLAAKTQTDDIQDEFYSVLCVVSLATFLVALAMLGGAGFLAQAFFEGATWVVRVTALIVMTYSLDWLLLSYFRAFRQMKTYCIFTIADRYVQIGVIICLVLSGHGVLSAVIALLAVRTVLLAALFLTIRSQIGIKRPHFSRIKEYLAFGLMTIPGNVSYWVIDSSDRYVIGYILGTASVGVYSASYNLGHIPFLAAGVLGFVLTPTLSKLYDEGNLTELRTHLSYTLKYVLALVIPFVFGAAVLAEPLLELFSTAQIARQGYFVVPLVAASSLLWCVYSVMVQVLVVAKRIRIAGIAWAGSALVNLVLNIVAIPHIGILGAAITTIIAYLLGTAVVAFYAYRELSFGIEWRFIGKSLLASAAMAAVLWALYPSTPWHSLLVVAVGVLVYSAGLLVLRGFKRQEFTFLRGLFRQN